MKMKKVAMVLVVVGMMALGISTVMGASFHEITIMQKDKIGKYLADYEGKTLYWFKKDSPGKTACLADCLDKWPIYYRKTVQVPKGIKAEDFKTITRPDGKKHTLFRGYPLYYWVNDKKPGDTSGHGVNKEWFVVNPDTFRSK
jgi:predicted lipoprotein with Yx(FWY)xxD motif